MHKHNFGQTLKLQSAMMTLNIRSRSSKSNETALLSTQNKFKTDGYENIYNFTIEPEHEISNNVMRDQQSLRSACAYAQSDQSLC